MNVSRSKFKNLSLNEVLEALECNEDEPVPDTITIFPPENCTGDITDEDSGDENSVMLLNLPGSQLRVQAIIAGNDTSGDDDEDDDVTQRTSKEDILICKCNDNGVVTVASNYLKVTPTIKTRRFSQKQKKYIQINQPAAIKIYNENMGDVDRSDQNFGLYRTSIRGKKWYFSLIAHCLDMPVNNAWQLYRHNGGKYDNLRFRRGVATALLETYGKGVARKPGRTSKNFQEASRYDDIGHLIKYRSEQLRCAVCHKNALFFCMKCNVSLHPKICFEAYHKLAE